MIQMQYSGLSYEGIGSSVPSAYVYVVAAARRKPKKLVQVSGLTLER
jgi:hypothetical protein